MGKQVGWICLHRQIQECFLWDMDEPFDHRSAWIDLLLLANHDEKKVLFRGKVITVKRGQRITSIRKLSKRWGWSVEKTYKFLNILEEENMIDRDSDNSRTLLTVVNYGKYNDVPNTKQNTERTQTSTQNEHRTNTEQNTPRTQNRTLPEREADTNNNDNNDNNENNELTMTNNENNEKQVLDAKASMTSEMSEVMNRWNELEHLGIIPIRSVTHGSERDKMFRKLIRVHGVDEICIAISRIQNSPFLLGKKSNFQIKFDWFIKEGNFQKVLEGNYKDRGDTQVIEEDLETRMKRLGLFGSGGG